MVIMMAIISIIEYNNTRQLRSWFEDWTYSNCPILETHYEVGKSWARKWEQKYRLQRVHIAPLFANYLTLIQVTWSSLDLWWVEFDFILLYLLGGSILQGNIFPLPLCPSFMSSRVKRCYYSTISGESGCSAYVALIFTFQDCGMASRLSATFHS